LLCSKAINNLNFYFDSKAREAACYNQQLARHSETINKAIFYFKDFAEAALISQFYYI